jgi:hypothetical protein
MSVDELRARFSQLAEKVVPMEDPHGRLMSRRRKRFRARIASVATLTAAVIAGGVATPASLLDFTGGPELQPEVIQPLKALTADDYVDRLIKAPIRGNLSGDLEMVTSVQKAFSEFKPEDQGAVQPNLVFLNRTDHMLQAVVIYTGGEKPIAVARGSVPNGSAKDLIADSGAVYTTPVVPFLVMPLSAQYGKAEAVVGLAPPGCAIDYSAKGRFTTDGVWMRSFDPEPTGDYAIRVGRTVNELWRVNCDGRVREVRFADDDLDGVGAEENAAAMFERVVRFSGATSPGKGKVQWRGRLSGFKSEITVVSSYSIPGPAMLAVGSSPKAILATDIWDKGPTPSPTTLDRDEEWPMVSLGVTAEGITVIRVPQPFGDRTVLGNQVFVYTQSGAARVEAVGRDQRVIATAPVRDQVAILSFAPGLAGEVRTLTSRGALQSSVRFAELAKGSRVLGDQLFKDW